ncbi:MAG: hypothetical protein IBX55_00095 [Methyloprofundus sp.]|nr:hypothetical protein [Methyloprofundus sp.]
MSRYLKIKSGFKLTSLAMSVSLMGLSGASLADNAPHAIFYDGVYHDYKSLVKKSNARFSDPVSYITNSPSGGLIYVFQNGNIAHEKDGILSVGNVFYKDKNLLELIPIQKSPVKEVVSQEESFGDLEDSDLESAAKLVMHALLKGVAEARSASSNPEQDKGFKELGKFQAEGKVPDNEKNAIEELLFKSEQNEMTGDVKNELIDSASNDPRVKKLIDEHGRDVAFDFIEMAGLTPERVFYEQMYARTFGIEQTFGEASGKRLVLFVDPNCPHSRNLFSEFQRNKENLQGLTVDWVIANRSDQMLDSYEQGALLQDGEFKNGKLKMDFVPTEVDPKYRVRVIHNTNVLNYMTKRAGYDRLAMPSAFGINPNGEPFFIRGSVEVDDFLMTSLGSFEKRTAFNRKAEVVTSDMLDKTGLEEYSKKGFKE